MTRKQLQTLISAGVFSAALLSGAAYADDATQNAGGTPPAPAVTTPAPTPPAPGGTSAAPVKPKHHKHHMKNMAKHACAGQNGCKGQGGCKTGDAGCSGKNSCKGKGGCATDGSKK